MCESRTTVLMDTKRSCRRTHALAAILLAWTTTSSKAFLTASSALSAVPVRHQQRRGASTYSHRVDSGLIIKVNNDDLDDFQRKRPTKCRNTSVDGRPRSHQLRYARTCRKGFVQQVASAAACGLAAVCVAPRPTPAKDFAGIEFRGLDVTEVLHPGAGEGGKATKPLRDCLLNVERVRISTKQLEDTLNDEGAPSGLTGLVKALVKNYKLDESLQQGAKYIESQRDRSAAASAGREAVEFLAQTAEYYPVEIDDRTGAPKKMSAEALEFTVNALTATRAKLDFFLSKVPTEALQEVRAEISADAGST